MRLQIADLGGWIPAYVGMTWECAGMTEGVREWIGDLRLSIVD